MSLPVSAFPLYNRNANSGNGIDLVVYLVVFGDITLKLSK